MTKQFNLRYANMTKQFNLHYAQHDSVTDATLDKQCNIRYAQHGSGDSNCKDRFLFRNYHVYSRFIGSDVSKK